MSLDPDVTHDVEDVKGKTGAPESRGPVPSRAPLTLTPPEHFRPMSDRIAANFAHAGTNGRAITKAAERRRRAVHGLTFTGRHVTPQAGTIPGRAACLAACAAAGGTYPAEGLFSVQHQ